MKATPACFSLKAGKTARKKIARFPQKSSAARRNENSFFVNAMELSAEAVRNLQTGEETMNSIQVLDIRKEKNRIDIFFQASKEIEHFFQPDHHFFVEYTFDVSAIPDSIAIIPILTNLLQLSWLDDFVIWVNEIDYDFYHCIRELKSSLQEMHRDCLFGGTIIAAKQIKNRCSVQRDAILLFTGGVDATASLIRILDKKPVLLNTNGWYISSPDEENPVYDADFEVITDIADQNGLSACFVKSNFATFIKSKTVNEIYGKKTNSTWWFGFQHSLAFLGCAMLAAYHYGAGAVYIASSYTFGQYVKCVSDPRIDTCVRCAGIETVHDGYELSRQDKVKRIVDYQQETGKQIKLRVCSFNTHNCCKCEKCFRTMLALISEGAEDVRQFGFDQADHFLDSLKTFIEFSAMELDHDHAVFWKDIILKLRKGPVNEAYKAAVDYLSGIDLEKARKQSIYHHYRRDFFEIIKRKLHQ